MVNLSTTRRAAVEDAILACIAEAARTGAPSPTYNVMMVAIRAAGTTADRPTLANALMGLKEAGRLIFCGTRMRRSYRLPDGTAPLAQPCRGDLLPHELMSEAEWRERFRRPDGTYARYEDVPGAPRGDVQCWTHSAVRPSASGRSLTGSAAAMVVDSR